jgi:hypothetical protein
MGATDQESTNAHNVVLLVDDEVSILSALRLLLEPKGFKVIVAANPFAAVKLAVTDQYLGQHVVELWTPVQLEPYPERRPDRGVGPKIAELESWSDSARSALRDLRR